MSHDVVIRELTDNLLDERFLDVLGHLSSVGIDVARARDVLRERNANGVRTYVALEGDRIVGTASLVVEVKFTHGGRYAGHIEDVVVHGESQGRGIGKKLVEHVTNEARAAGCYKAVLGCASEKKPFYEKCGYRENGFEMRVDL